jgi:hypothetical protein
MLLNRIFALASLVAMSLVAGGDAWACPSCPVGRAARQQLLDDDFGRNLVIALAPFLVVGLVARWAERIGRDVR